MDDLLRELLLPGLVGAVHGVLDELSAPRLPGSAGSVRLVLDQLADVVQEPCGEQRVAVRGDAVPRFDDVGCGERLLRHRADMLVQAPARAEARRILRRVLDLRPRAFVPALDPDLEHARAQLGVGDLFDLRKHRAHVRDVVFRHLFSTVSSSMR